MGTKDDKASDFIERNTVTSEDGAKRLNATKAILELYARMKTLQIQMMEVQECLACISEIEERVSKLEGNKKIDIISPDQAKIILGNNG